MVEQRHRIWSVEVGVGGLPAFLTHLIEKRPYPVNATGTVHGQSLPMLLLPRRSARTATFLTSLMRFSVVLRGIASMSGASEAIVPGHPRCW